MNYEKLAYIVTRYYTMAWSKYCYAEFDSKEYHVWRNEYINLIPIYDMVWERI